MNYWYRLEIAHADPPKVAEILGRPSSADENRWWTFELQESEKDKPLAFVDIFSDLLEGKMAQLSFLGIQREDITVWMLYEYEQECNLEFSPHQLQRLGEAGITLCVSCWQAADPKIS